MSDRADWRAVLICKKYILIIIILAVVFLPQCFVYASDTEITDKIEQQMLEKIDMSEIEKYSKTIVFGYSGCHSGRRSKGR